jgi:hypothetical protein
MIWIPQRLQFDDGPAQVLYLNVELVEPLPTAPDQASHAPHLARYRPSGAGGLVCRRVHSRIVYYHFGIEQINGGSVLIDFDGSEANGVEADVNA